MRMRGCYANARVLTFSCEKLRVPFLWMCVHWHVRAARSLVYCADDVCVRVVLADVHARGYCTDIARSCEPQSDTRVRVALICLRVTRSRAHACCVFASASAGAGEGAGAG